MQKIILDASILLVIINREAGFERVMTLLEENSVFMSAVNYEEVLTKCVDRETDTLQIQDLTHELEIRSLAFDSDLAMISAKLRQATRFKGLSLGDRACLATAQSQQAIAVTADRIWCELDLNIDIQCIR